MRPYQSVVLDPAGGPINGVEITVYKAGTTTVAPIYSDNGVTSKANPFTNDSNGSFEFYAAGRLDIKRVKSGVTFDDNDLKDILLVDPVIPGQCRLEHVNSTTIRLTPEGGNQIMVKRGGSWEIRTIPSAGIDGSNTNTYVNGTSGQGLAASTLYYVCLFDDAGTLKLDFISFATGRAKDADTGLPIKSGDPTRALVGLIRTNASSQFVNGIDGYLSWWNRRLRSGTKAFSADRTKTDTTYVEIDSEIRQGFLLWSGDVVSVAAVGAHSNNTPGDVTFESVGFDGATAEDVYQRDRAEDAAFHPFALYLPKAGLAEGYHDVRLLGKTSSGFTSTWRGSATAGDRTSLQVVVQG